MGTCTGCLLGGYLATTRSQAVFVSKQLLLQGSQAGAGSGISCVDKYHKILSSAFSILCLYLVSGFYGYSMCAAIYGIFFGCYLYTAKIFCYTIVRTKHFSRTWSILQAAMAAPALAGVMATGNNLVPFSFLLFHLPLLECQISLLLCIIVGYFIKNILDTENLRAFAWYAC